MSKIHNAFPVVDGTLPVTWNDGNNAELDQENRDATDVDFTGDPGLTLQAPAEEADLNVIIKRFGVTDGSRLPRWQDPNAMYGDFSEFPTDPVELAEIIRQGDVAFAALPAELRARFGTGGQMYNWLKDPKNHDEAVTIGLLQRPPLKPMQLEDLAEVIKTSVSPSTSSDKE